MLPIVSCLLILQVPCDINPPVVASTSVALLSYYYYERNNIITVTMATRGF